MKFTLLILCTILSLWVYAQKEINLSDAVQHINKQVEVTGRVLAARVLPTEGAPVFLKLGAAKSDTYLMVMILGDYRLKFAAAPRDAIHKRVQVSGKVQMVDGKPMIVVRQANQIVTIPEKVKRHGVFRN